MKKYEPEIKYYPFSSTAYRHIKGYGPNIKWFSFYLVSNLLSSLSLLIFAIIFIYEILAIVDVVSHNNKLFLPFSFLVFITLMIAVQCRPIGIPMACLMFYFRSFDNKPDMATNLMLPILSCFGCVSLIEDKSHALVKGNYKKNILFPSYSKRFGLTTHAHTHNWKATVNKLLQYGSIAVFDISEVSNSLKWEHDEFCKYFDNNRIIYISKSCINDEVIRNNLYLLTGQYSDTITKSLILYNNKPIANLLLWVKVFHQMGIIHSSVDNDMILRDYKVNIRLEQREIDTNRLETYFMLNNVILDPQNTSYLKEFRSWLRQIVNLNHANEDFLRLFLVGDKLKIQWFIAIVHQYMASIHQSFDELDGVEEEYTKALKKYEDFVEWIETFHMLRDLDDYRV